MSKPMARRVILLSLDCVRADRLGCYGYGPDTTPHLDALAEAGIRFDRCTAASNWTPPSHASMFTGTWPTEHGVSAFHSVIASKCRTTAELFHDHGWYAGAISTWRCFRPGMGIMRGFDEALVFGETKTKDNGDVQTARALEWIDRHRDTPSFLFLHYGQAHAPYERCPGFESVPFSVPDDRRAEPLWESTPLPAWYRALEAATDRVSGNGPLGRFVQRGARWTKAHFVRTLYSVIREIKEGKIDLPPEVLTFLSARYDNCLRYVDRKVGELVEGLKRSGLWGDSLIIITGDHGDEFGEHGAVDHGHTLYEELVRVPMVLTGGTVDGARQVCPTRVGHCDILPTLLSAAGFDVVEQVRGTSLMDLAAPEDARRTLYAEHRGDDREMAAVVQGDWKYLVDYKEGGRALYHLDGGVSEDSDESGDQPEIASALATVLEEITAALDAGHALPSPGPDRQEQESMDEELRRQLEQLGYL